MDEDFLKKKLEGYDFNFDQKRAIRAVKEGCLGNDEFTLPIVDGPPGTGKTLVASAGVTSCLVDDPKEQFMYLCPTHYAARKAKETLETLGFPKEEVVRLTPNISGRVSERDISRGVIGCRSDLSNLSSRVKRMVKNCKVVVSTLHGVSRVLRTRKSSARIVVDEFSQVDPSLFFSTVARSRGLGPSSYALFGDPEQLPVVTTQPLLRENIADFIVRRKDYTPHKLGIQYRMHEDICKAVNELRDCLNAPPINSHKEVRYRNLTEMGYDWDENRVKGVFREILDPDHPFVMVNTDKCGEEDRSTFGRSVRNQGEARLAAKISKLFHKTFTHPSEGKLRPTVLSPYSAQVGEIDEMTDTRHVDCTTIWSSQGREYPCVIISFTRNNPEGNIGFLKGVETRAQSYVGCSRAQAKLVLLISRETFTSSEISDYERLFNASSALIVEDVDEALQTFH